MRKTPPTTRRTDRPAQSAMPITNTKMGAELFMGTLPRVPDPARCGYNSSPGRPGQPARPPGSIPMMAVRNILFDLDGTLLDSQRGILAGLRRALQQMGHELPAGALLDW